jgi:hypothetical protein
MLKPVTFVVVSALVVAGAVVNGMATQRWSFVTPDPTVTNKLHALEIQFDDWQGVEVQTEMPTNERSTATSRQYTSARTGRSGAVSFISGVPGSVSTHTPDVCYPSSGYKTLRAAKKETTELPGGRTATYYVADFEKKTATKSDRARVRWAWTTDGTWIAPDNPRWQFARQLATVPVLYKVYIVTPLPDEADDRTADDAVTAAFVTACWTQYAAAFGK